MAKPWFLLGLFLIVGCKSADDFVGSGPLIMSSHIEKFYREEYLKKVGPQYFIVSRDGRQAGYTYCSNGISGCGGAGIVFRTLTSCEKRAGVSCYIFDKAGSVVWSGPVTYGDAKSGPAKRDRAKRQAERQKELKAMPIQELCDAAVAYDGETPIWWGGMSNSHAVEASDRGLTPEFCDRLTK